MTCPNCGFETISRNLEQNALFHLWMQVLADELGYLSLEDVKRDIKRQILGTKEVVNQITGELTFEDVKTSRMTMKQMATFMDKVKIWALTEMNIYLPYKKDDPSGYSQMYKQFNT